MKVTLKALRVNAGITQRDAAEAIGVTRETLQNWEKNKTSPTASQLIQMCEIYNCGLEDIFLPGMLAKSEREETA